MVNFDTAYAMFRQQITHLSRSQHVPGMDPDDVASEMMILLWKATQTWQPDKGSFGGYWWSLWRHRRIDILGMYYAAKRLHGVPANPVPEGTSFDLLFPIPPETDAFGMAVWGALAIGFTPVEVQRQLDLTRSRYYRIIKRWRTDEVHQMLAEGGGGTDRG